MMKNVFYFTLKALFGLDFLVMYRSNLIRKIRLISKYMAPEHGKQAIAIQILPIGKDNQKTKFGQLIEHNMRHIFLENSNTKCVGEASPRPYP